MRIRGVKLGLFDRIDLSVFDNSVTSVFKTRGTYRSESHIIPPPRIEQVSRVGQTESGYNEEETPRLYTTEIASAGLPTRSNRNRRKFDRKYKKMDSPRAFPKDFYFPTQTNQVLPKYSSPLVISRRTYQAPHPSPVFQKHYPRRVKRIVFVSLLATGR
jgi:hypothetical protein